MLLLLLLEALVPVDPPAAAAELDELLEPQAAMSSAPRTVTAIARKPLPRNLMRVLDRDALISFFPPLLKMWLVGVRARRDQPG